MPAQQQNEVATDRPGVHERPIRQWQNPGGADADDGGEHPEGGCRQAQQRHREEEQDAVGRQDHVDRHTRGIQQHPDAPDDRRPHDQASSRDDERATRRGPAPRARPRTGHESDRDSRERREQDRGPPVDEIDPRRGLRSIEMRDHQQVRGEHPEHRETPREIDAGEPAVAIQRARGADGGPSSSSHRPHPDHCWRSSQTSRAFWACSRFSASSQTTLCGPSMTSASTS